MFYLMSKAPLRMPNALLKIKSGPGISQGKACEGRGRSILIWGLFAPGLIVHSSRAKELGGFDNYLRIKINKNGHLVELGKKSCHI